MAAEEIEKLLSEVTILKGLNSPTIIELYDSWVSEDKSQICFITEFMTSGTLKQFIARAGDPKPKVLKHWCREILLGLQFLHSRRPCIIHRYFSAERGGGDGEGGGVQSFSGRLLFLLSV